MAVVVAVVAVVVDIVDVVLPSSLALPLSSLFMPMSLSLLL